MAKAAVYLGSDADFDWVASHWWEYPQWHKMEVRIGDYSDKSGYQGDSYVGRVINDGVVGYATPKPVVTVKAPAIKTNMKKEAIYADAWQFDALKNRWAELGVGAVWEKYEIRLGEVGGKVVAISEPYSGPVIIDGVFYATNNKPVAKTNWLPLAIVVLIIGVVVAIFRK